MIRWSKKCSNSSIINTGMLALHNHNSSNRQINRRALTTIVKMIVPDIKITLRNLPVNSTSHPTMYKLLTTPFKLSSLSNGILRQRSGSQLPHLNQTTLLKNQTYHLTLKIHQIMQATIPKWITRMTLIFMPAAIRTIILRSNIQLQAKWTWKTNLFQNN